MPSHFADGAKWDRRARSALGDGEEPEAATPFMATILAGLASLARSATNVGEGYR
eukprot:COSAG06_NODE_571_length_14101_cov_12.481682_21_plen_55_part_00